MISDKTIFKISKLFRLQWEPAQNAHVLLYPEGMVKLNDSAGEIMSRIDGEKNLNQIIGDIESHFKTEGLRDDVVSFIEIALNQGWIKSEVE
ncbi:MAG: pyrroloquinoline quinone biosynthesis protein PqqD [Betaproteobacteria bacterium TMED156]|nr:MAG: pyrroloquinoline quinone biosynthesis protein PqqD [Betaproteobacteria bacterium TMED156]|tara:strand:- start:2123 stop:2398 length:276 start_codon:yes stop_codon:yes gene_type:complete